MKVGKERRHSDSSQNCNGGKMSHQRIEEDSHTHKGGGMVSRVDGNVGHTIGGKRE